MVQCADTDQLQGGLQTDRDRLVRGTRFGDAGRMIVGEYHGGSVVRECLFDDLADMHGGAVDRAPEQGLEHDQPMAVVKEQTAEHLVAKVPQAGPQITANGFRMQKYVFADQGFTEMPTGEFQRGPQPRKGDRADAALREYNVRTGAQERPQRTKVMQQPSGDLDGVGIAYPGSEENRQQFGVGQGFSATAQQFFARSFVRGPVPNTHDEPPCSETRQSPGAAFHDRPPSLAHPCRTASFKAGLPFGSRVFWRAMSMLKGRNVLLGVTGGIAAYKSPDLVRRLRERGSDVQVVMTSAAKRFVTPLTFQAVSGREVCSDLWDEAAEAAMGHIELARWANLILVAPATADFLARLAHGMADDLLATLCLASDAPIAVAPAMNRVMWTKPATQANVATLTDRGVTILGPGEGNQACGETGPGRMFEPVQLVDSIDPLLAA